MIRNLASVHRFPSLYCDFINGYIGEYIEYRFTLYRNTIYKSTLGLNNIFIPDPERDAFEEGPPPMLRILRYESSLKNNSDCDSGQ